MEGANATGIADSNANLLATTVRGSNANGTLRLKLARSRDLTKSILVGSNAVIWIKKLVHLCLSFFFQIANEGSNENLRGITHMQTGRLFP